MRLDGHHVMHRGRGGATTLANLVLLCHRHHWMVHEGGWHVVRTDGHRILAIPPSHTYQSWTRGPVELASG
jgi:HNH endonuclease